MSVEAVNKRQETVELVYREHEVKTKTEFAHYLKLACPSNSDTLSCAYYRQQFQAPVVGAMVPETEKRSVEVRHFRLHCPGEAACC
jgi:hypothetical protein